MLPVQLPFTMSIEHVSRHLIKTVRQKPLVCAAVTAATALVAWWMMVEEEEEEEEEEVLACVHRVAGLDVKPTPKSFTVTNERGELRGQVDETALSWSWFVEEEQWALLVEP